MEITIEQYEEIGTALQHGGMTDDEIDAYFEHSGVKGMKWGVRRQQKNTAKFQKRQDRLRTIAKGHGTKGQKFVAGFFNIPMNDLVVGGGVKGGSQLVLAKNKVYQARMAEGKMRVSNRLLKMRGIKISDLDFSY